MAMRRAAFFPMGEQVPSKLERLIELVDEAIEGGQKVIVFSYFRTVIEQVMLALGNTSSWTQLLVQFHRLCAKVLLINSKLDKRRSCVSWTDTSSRNWT
jgi:hypothetical protein